MMVLAILSPLLAFPLVLATQLLEKWTMEPTRPTSAPQETPVVTPHRRPPLKNVRELTVVVGPEE